MIQTYHGLATLNAYIMILKLNNGNYFKSTAADEQTTSPENGTEIKQKQMINVGRFKNEQK